MEKWLTNPNPVIIGYRLIIILYGFPEARSATEVKEFICSKP